MNVCILLSLIIFLVKLYFKYGLNSDLHLKASHRYKGNVLFFDRKMMVFNYIEQD